MKILLPENFPNPRRKGTAAAPPKYKGGVALRCCPHFFVMVFVSQHTAALVFFLKDKKKNTRAAANAPTKTHAKKNEGS